MFKISRIALVLIAVISAGVVYHDSVLVSDFIAAATKVKGLIVSNRAGEGGIVTFPVDGELSSVTCPKLKREFPRQVDVFYIKSPNGLLDARIEKMYCEWDHSGFWTGFGLMTALLALYLREIITDPFSIIGFRWWKPRKPR